MVKKKRQSKRITLKDKYKIERRVTESHRKTKKQAKRDAKNGIVKHKKTKDPGIPNSWPFKQDLLNEIGRARERAEEALVERKEAHLAKVRGITTAKKQTLEDMMGDAAKTQAEFAAKQSSSSSAATPVTAKEVAHGQQSRRAYLRECKKVLDNADVILQVLDARDPIGTRIGRSMEDAILSRSDRKMVLVLNKVDLIPKAAVTGWLNHLRRSHPTIAIRAGKNQGQAKGEGALLNSTSAIGMEGILNILKNYARIDGQKKKSCITVGIIGYPNVGKSSIVNSLKRARAVGVSARPGFTTCMQEVVLDKNIRLLDSPGVVFDDDYASGDNGSAVLLRNCVDVDTIPDPIPAVQSLITRCTKESLMMTYAIPAFPDNNADIFLAMVAKKLGKVKRGGVPDKVMAARAVLRDWNGGKIPYFTPVPTTTASSEQMDTADDNDNLGGPIIVNKFGAEFDVQLMQSLGNDDRDEMDFVQLTPAAAVVGSKKTTKILTTEGDDDDSASEMEDNTKEKGIVDNAAMADAEDYDFAAMTS